MSLYLGTRDRLLYLTFGQPYSLPGLVPNRIIAPDVTLSPRTADGRLTRGMAIAIMPVGGADPLTTGFTISIFRATTVGTWGAYKMYTAAQYLDQIITWDVPGGAGLVFCVGNCATAGGVLAVAELG